MVAGQTQSRWTAAHTFHSKPRTQWQQFILKPAGGARGRAECNLMAPLESFHIEEPGVHAWVLCLYTSSLRWSWYDACMCQLFIYLFFPRNSRNTRQQRDGKREEMPPNRWSSLLKKKPKKKKKTRKHYKYQLSNLRISFLIRH